LRACRPISAARNYNRLPASARSARGRATTRVAWDLSITRGVRLSLGPCPLRKNYPIEIVVSAIQCAVEDSSTFLRRLWSGAAIAQTSRKVVETVISRPCSASDLAARASGFSACALRATSILPSASLCTLRSLCPLRLSALAPTSAVPTRLWRGGLRSR